MTQPYHKQQAYRERGGPIGTNRAGDMPGERLANSEPQLRSHLDWSANAILIVEFCVALRREGKGIVESGLEAARLRFRLIVMTSLAFMLGVLPLAIPTGAGAAVRHSIGTGVIGGMLAATFLAIFFVPVFFVLTQRLTEAFTARRRSTPIARRNWLPAIDDRVWCAPASRIRCLIVSVACDEATRAAPRPGPY